jgi:hypothetical protein
MCSFFSNAQARYFHDPLTIHPRSTKSTQAPTPDQIHSRSTTCPIEIIPRSTQDPSKIHLRSIQDPHKIHPRSSKIQPRSPTFIQDHPRSTKIHHHPPKSQPRSIQSLQDPPLDSPMRNLRNKRNVLVRPGDDVNVLQSFWKVKVAKGVGHGSANTRVH